MKLSALIQLPALVLTLAQVGAPASDANVANAVPLTPALITALVEEMRSNHPALKAADGRVRAATQGVGAVRRWEDPMVKFGGVVASARGPNLAEEGDLAYGIEQRLPLFGKPEAALRVAASEVQLQTSRSDMEFQLRRRELAKALFDFALAGHTVAVGTEDLALLDTLIATVQTRLSTGMSSQVELLRLQNEQARRAEALRTDQARRDLARVVVNRFLNRALTAPLPDYELPPVGLPVPFSNDLVDLAVHFEPKLRVLKEEVAQAGATAEAVRLARRPDVSLGIEGRQFTGDGGFREGMFTVSLNLPWFNQSKYRAEERRERERVRALEFEVLDQQQAVRQEVHQLTVMIDAARREAVLYRDDIRPRSELALATARSAWESGRGMFNDVIEARRMLVEARLMEHRAVAEQYRALSELVLCCGLGDLEALNLVIEKPSAGTKPPSKP